MLICRSNLHQRGIVFALDGSVRQVGLKGLWTLKWHRNYNTAGPEECEP